MNPSDENDSSDRSVSGQSHAESVDRCGSSVRAHDNDRRIVAALPLELRSRFEQSILGRQDLEVRFVAESETAIELARRRPPSLLLLYDSGFGALPGLLASLGRSDSGPPFPVIVVAEFPDDCLCDRVTTILPVDIAIGDLSVTIAKALDLPTRARRRQLIRIDIKLDEATTFSTTGNTVDISGTGMLIECSRRLRIGVVYQVSILGAGDVPMLDLRLVRQAEAGHPNLNRYGGAFENVEPDEVEALIRRLE